MIIANYILAADGACSGNPGPGGWGFALFSDEARPENELARGSDINPDTTNNMMELQACIHGLQSLDGHTPGAVALRFDSEYVLNGIFEWMAGWKARGWRKSDGKRVSNADQWVMIDTLIADLRAKGFIFEKDWVKGHDGDFANELVDQLAADARDRAKFNVETDTVVESLIAEHAAPIAPQNNPVTPPELSEVNPDQVALMRTILDLYASGDHSVKDVVKQIRANKIALGCV